MNTTPGANTEYSRGSGASRGGNGGGSGASARWTGRRNAAADEGGSGLVLAGALIGALLLLVAEFTTLYQVHLATRLNPIQSVTSGSHNSYAMIPIAVLGAALGIGAWRSGSRPALLALGVLGVVALLIALVGDLPDAHAAGLAQQNSISATATPSAGLYMETLGAIVLIATCGLGFLMLGFGSAGASQTGGPGGRRRPPAGEG